MRTTRIYQNQLLATGSRLVLDAETSHYLGTVLRLRPGAALLVFNSRDGEFAAHIASAEKQSLSIELSAQQRPPSAASLSIHLGLGISRGDRMDFAIQKSTELGVSHITPVYSQYGEVKLKEDRVENKLRHWSRIATSAAEQSGRLDIPAVSTPQSLEEWQSSLGESVRLLLDPSGPEKIGQNIGSREQGFALLIGPEGGFAERELEWAVKRGFKIVSLGPRILRTETAPAAALAILQHRFGDM